MLCIASVCVTNDARDKLVCCRCVSPKNVGECFFFLFCYSIGGGCVFFCVFIFIEPRSAILAIFNMYFFLLAVADVVHWMRVGFFLQLVDNFGTQESSCAWVRATPIVYIKVSPQKSSQFNNSLAIKE